MGGRIEMEGGREEVDENINNLIDLKTLIDKGASTFSTSEVTPVKKVGDIPDRSERDGRGKETRGDERKKREGERRDVL